MKIDIEKTHTPEEIQDYLKDIFHYFGYKNQKEKLLEEIEEFQNAEHLSENELEELCDIWIVISGILITTDRSEEIIQYKINRTLERIEKGYYD